MRRRHILVAGATAVAAALLAANPAFALDPFGPSGTVTVTPAAQNQFAGTFDRGAGDRAFTSRLGAPPDGGAGALELRTPGDGDKVQFVTHEVAGPLSRFASSSYRAVRDPAAPGEAAPSFQIAVDIDGGELGPQELHLLTYLPEPAPPGRWTRYDVGSGTFCLTRQTGSVDAYRECADGAPRYSLDEVAAAHPGVTAYAAGVNQGAGNAGLVSAVDLIQVGNRTYDLEPG
ncbi:hypothetical protein [Pseudonocardia sp. HH130630-07]|uniref:hypothetical protein n=1 Tax=Pseudonocardia sp. HH130630-07 TaxID=1690815 RepID=UPI000814DE09|nr:hypothetical protein [Pseudonocardia sp. HH130630-07]ANY08637.1 hypothetical protein AFB00_22860 [Pseudonocardia sp. HH130630-07]